MKYILQGIRDVYECSYSSTFSNFPSNLREEDGKLLTACRGFIEFSRGISLAMFAASFS